MSSEGGGYFRGLVTGVIVGAATALLLTPKRGEDIRHEIVDSASRLKDKAGGLGDQLSETAHELKERGAHLVENVRERGGDLVAQAQDRVNHESNGGSGSDFASDGADTQSGDKNGSGKSQEHDVVESV